MSICYLESLRTEILLSKIYTSRQPKDFLLFFSYSKNRFFFASVFILRFSSFLSLCVLYLFVIKIDTLWVFFVLLLSAFYSFFLLFKQLDFAFFISKYFSIKILNLYENFFVFGYQNIYLFIKNRKIYHSWPSFMWISLYNERILFYSNLYSKSRIICY